MFDLVVWPEKTPETNVSLPYWIFCWSKYLTNILSENTEYFYLRGKRPTKQSISNPKTFTFKENIGR